MCWRSSVAAFVVVIGCASSATQALPRWAEPLGEAEGSASIVPVRGCHSDERTHFVPEVGRSLPHVHLGDDCEPYRISDSDGSSDDDDDDEDEDDSNVYDGDDSSDVCAYIAGVEVCN